MSTFKSVVTTLGQARIAAAIQAGTDIKITQLAVGDGNGKATTPVATQTRLVKEVYRTPLNSLKPDASHANWIIAEAIISASVGGFWMREMGLFADDGTLIAVCNMADTYKPTLAEGSGRTQTLRMVITVSDTEAITLIIDDSIVVATEGYANDLLAAHEKSRNHPDGTTAAKGFVQLSSSVTSDSETLAATPKAVKAANDNANGRLPSGGTAVAANKLATSRKIAGVAFDGTADISIPPANVGALPAGGTAVAATKLATARKIAGVAFDGTKDIAISAANVDGLGSAATKDVGTAAGDLMEVGAYGLGGNAVVATDANALVKNGFYKLIREGTHGPTYQAAAEIIHIQFDGASANQLGWNAGVGNGTMYHRARAGSVFGEWIPLLDQSGGTLKGDNALLVLQNTAAAADKKALYIRGLNSDGAMRWYVGNGSAGNDSVQLANYATGAQLQLTDMCTINKPLKVTGNFDATGSGNFPGGVASAAGVTLNSSALVGMYFGADAASFTNANLLLKSWNGIGFYNTCPTSGIQGITGYINVRTGNMEMKSTITPGDYANFDARFYTKTLANTTFTKVGVAYTKGESDGRYNLKNTASLGANGWHKDPTTGLITQWGTITASGAGWQTVTFPTAFPSACLNVQVTMINSSQGKFADNYGTAGSVTRTNFLCGRDNQGAYWEAKGY